MHIACALWTPGVWIDDLPTLSGIHIERAYTQPTWAWSVSQLVHDTPARWQPPPKDLPQYPPTTAGQVRVASDALKLIRDPWSTYLDDSARAVLDAVRG